MKTYPSNTEALFRGLPYKTNLQTDQKLPENHKKIFKRKSRHTLKTSKLAIMTQYKDLILKCLESGMIQADVCETLKSNGYYGSDAMSEYI